MSRHRRFAALCSTAAAAAATWFAPALAGAEAPHEHGVVHLDIAVDKSKITIQMSSPLDNLLGFERAPRTDDERRRTAAMVASLRAPAALFAIDAAADCKPGAVELASAALQLGKPDAAELQAGHADIDASFEFDCADAGRASFIDTALFRQYTGIQRIAVQVASNRGQRMATLTRPAQRIALPR
ncbi:MAG TPA: DUF2796 domain-containing protein [Burkholderiaceae bacterium]